MILQLQSNYKLDFVKTVTTKMDNHFARNIDMLAKLLHFFLICCEMTHVKVEFCLRKLKSEKWISTNRKIWQKIKRTKQCVIVFTAPWFGWQITVWAVWRTMRRFYFWAALKNYNKFKNIAWHFVEKTVRIFDSVGWVSECNCIVWYGYAKCFKNRGKWLPPKPKR